MPSWVYPIWMVLAGIAALIGARGIQPNHWTATIVVTLYLVYRGIAYVLLVVSNFPPSFIPVMLLSAGLVIDRATRWHWRPVVVSAALLLAF